MVVRWRAWVSRLAWWRVWVGVVGTRVAGLFFFLVVAGGVRDGGWVLEVVVVCVSVVGTMGLLGGVCGGGVVGGC